MILLRQKLTLCFCAVIFTFLALEGGMRLGGFILTWAREARNSAGLKQGHDYRIMCIGESTTAGGYPYLLEQILNDKQAGVRFKVINEGVVATTTPEILRNLERNLERYRPDMVIAMMGMCAPVSSSCFRISDVAW